MKRFILLSLFLISCLCMNGFIMPPVEQPTSQNEVVFAPADMAKVAEAKILNLLNLNNVYNDDFTDNEALVNAAAINLRSYATANGFIENSIITAYLKDIYDIDVEINDSINVNMPKKQGYVYLIPRGYSSYTHEILSITDNGDSVIVVSLVSVNSHDGTDVIGTATTTLIKNENSSFGYNIINSEIDYNAVSLQA